MFEKKNENNIQNEIVTNYDFEFYRKIILRMNFIIAIVVLVIEVAISILLGLENAIEQSLPEYLLRFLILPAGINFAVVALQYFLIKKEKYTENFRNQLSTIMLAIICCVVSYTHYVYGCTLLVYCIPIFTSVLFSNKANTRKVAIISIFGVILTAIERMNIRDGDANVIPEAAISIAVIILSTYIANKLIVLINDQNIKLIHSKKEADKANEAKGKFLASMSHEIRTPINAILGLDTMILRQSAEEQTLVYARDIQSAGKSLLAVINDILDFSKIESGKMELINEDYDFASLINDVVNMIRPKASEKDLEFVLKLDENIPSRFYGDELRIKQVLVNLLTNAVKYTPEGTVTLEVKYDIEKDDAVIHFAVIDTGIGIKPDDISKLSEEFVRIEEAKNKNIEGTGLGINIVINFLSLMGSKLKVDSVYGEGSNFHFDLKLPVTNEEPLGNFAERISNFANAEDYQVSFCIPDSRLLVVDDNSMNRIVFKNLLTDMGCAIDEADSGRQCLELVQTQKYDIIFMDHMMPEMDGIETFNRMNAMGDYLNKDTPVVILTANAISGAREHYIQEGFTDYISKPIDADKLEKMIGTLIPDEKKQVAKKKEKKLTDSIQKQIEDLPIIDGIDWISAIHKLRDKKILMDSLSGFSIMAASDMNTLKKMYDVLALNRGGKDFEDYRIKVHSMKSNAATFGGIHVAGLAKFLEYAARDEDFATIERLMPVFELEWSRLKAAIDEAFGFSNVAAGGDELSEIDTDELIEYLDMLVGAMGDMDFDRSDAIVEELLEHSYPEELKTMIDEIRTLEMSMSVDECADKVREVKELLGR